MTAIGSCSSVPGVNPGAIRFHQPDAAANTYITETGPGGETTGYLFDTRVLAGGVYGYGGPLVLAVSVDPAGIVRDYRILQSLETPVYLDFVRSRRQELVGKNIFEAQPFVQVDALSGATLTCNALMAALEQAGHRFALDVLGKSVAPVSPGRRPAGEWTGLAWLAGLALAAILARRRPNPWVRRAILAARLQHIPVILDGYVVTAAAAILHAIHPATIDHCVAGHLSAGGFDVPK